MWRIIGDNESRRIGVEGSDGWNDRRIRKEKERNEVKKKERIEDWIWVMKNEEGEEGVENSGEDIEWRILKILMSWIIREGFELLRKIFMKGRLWKDMEGEEDRIGRDEEVGLGGKIIRKDGRLREMVRRIDVDRKKDLRKKIEKDWSEGGEGMEGIEEFLEDERMKMILKIRSIVGGVGEGEEEKMDWRNGNRKGKEEKILKKDNGIEKKSNWIIVECRNEGEFIGEEKLKMVLKVLKKLNEIKIERNEWMLKKIEEKDERKLKNMRR